MSVGVIFERSSHPCPPVDVRGPDADTCTSYIRNHGPDRVVITFGASCGVLINLISTVQFVVKRAGLELLGDAR